jgi:hypothetical protein
MALPGIAAARGHQRLTGSPMLLAAMSDAQQNDA